jgi:GntR family transcriptional regulator, galactonate operon transcriptional repressor
MPAYSERGVHGQTVVRIAQRILAGDPAELETIDVAALQAELDVSLTVVREALKVLAAKGLVDARQRRGTFVRPRADWNLLDGDVIRWQFSGRADGKFLENLHEVRGIVEPAGARFAAQRRTDADLSALEDALAAMTESAGDPAAMVSADLVFHRALLAATHNELLERMEVVLKTGLAERDRLVHGAGHDDPVPSHRLVLDAIKAGDPDDAERAMRDLLDKARRDLERVSRGLDGGEAP